MKNFAFWKPIITGAAATPVFLFVAAVAAGAGHGSYLPMLVFYPVSLFLLMFGTTAGGIDDAFLKTIVESVMTASAVGAAIVQFPLYGFIISRSRSRQEPNWFAVWEIIVWLHVGICITVLPLALISMLF